MYIYNIYVCMYIYNIIYIHIIYTKKICIYIYIYVATEEGKDRNKI